MDMMQADEHLQNIARALVGLAPSGWEKVELHHQVAATISNNRATVSDALGTRTLELGRIMGTLALELRRLRAAAYKPGGGGFYHAHVTVTSDGTYAAEYDYSTEPFQGENIHPSTWTEDLERFGRDDTNHPAWLTDKLS